MCLQDIIFDILTFLELQSRSLYSLCLQYNMFWFSLRVCFNLVTTLSLLTMSLCVCIFLCRKSLCLHFWQLISVYGCCYGRLICKRCCFFFYIIWLKVATTTEQQMLPVPLANGKRQGAKRGLIKPHRVREAERILCFNCIQAGWSTEGT